MSDKHVFSKNFMIWAILSPVILASIPIIVIIIDKIWRAKP